ncbi:TetR/AcrR family transcriptional regulator [Endozoicomonas ascidiicola]|uniref:TetR/AcrR family transcriptional regulator n=1 Tax=Endozoicomonas ascidiicola TaxID=1698521 RepID=UPI000837834E|nr:TetR/AcrR family transcriptional regulator [Endozoicomonas ascidiicola]
MGRTCCIDPPTAINAALDQFWLMGFSACSLKQLEEATGMNPGSLYYHFKNKEQLYLSALSYYIDKHLQPRVSKYLHDAVSLIQLRRFFTSGYRHKTEFNYRSCCFLVSASHEQHLLPEESEDLMHKGIKVLTDGFKAALSKPMLSDNLPNNNIESYAHQLLGLYLSIQVFARFDLNQQSLDRQVCRCLHSLFPTHFPEK